MRVLLHAAAGIEGRSAWHVYVQEDEVWLRFWQSGQGVIGTADSMDVVARISEDVSKQPDKPLVVIGNENGWSISMVLFFHEVYNGTWA